MKRLSVKATWDEGWSGRFVHSLGNYDDHNPKSMTVQQVEDDEPLLYVLLDGERFTVRKKTRVGF